MCEMPPQDISATGESDDLQNWEPVVVAPVEVVDAFFARVSQGSRRGEVGEVGRGSTEHPMAREWNSEQQEIQG